MKGLNGFIEFEFSLLDVPSPACFQFLLGLVNFSPQAHSAMLLLASRTFQHSEILIFLLLSRSKQTFVPKMSSVSQKHCALLFSDTSSSYSGYLVI